MKKLTIIPFLESAGYKLRVFHPFHGRFFNTNSTYVNSGLLLLFLSVVLLLCFLDHGGKSVFCQMPTRGLEGINGIFTIPDSYAIGENGCVLLPDYETALFESVNKIRKEHNLPPYEMDRRLVTFAREKGEDMLANGYIDHDSPRLGRPGQEASRKGVVFSTYGENLAGTLRAKDMQPELAFSLLMESECHRGAILSDKKSHLGIGVVKGPDKGVVFVMHFLSL
ncbi:MAG: CAP domain-containing protein [Dethiobacteria bacterium]